MHKNTRLYLTVMIIIALISSFMTVYAHGAREIKRTGISGIIQKIRQLKLLHGFTLPP